MNRWKRDALMVGDVQEPIFNSTFHCIILDVKAKRGGRGIENTPSLITKSKMLLRSSARAFIHIPRQAPKSKYVADARFARACDICLAYHLPVSAKCENADPLEYTSGLEPSCHARNTHPARLTVGDFWPPSSIACSPKRMSLNVVIVVVSETSSGMVQRAASSTRVVYFSVSMPPKLTNYARCVSKV